MVTTVGSMIGDDATDGELASWLSCCACGCVRAASMAVRDGTMDAAMKMLDI
jgi:hypothetical protein